MLDTRHADSRLKTAITHSGRAQAQTSSTVTTRVMARGCDRFFNHSFLGFLSHPGAITPMGAITLIGMR